jgi:hypothetical protein
MILPCDAPMDSNYGLRFALLIVAAIFGLIFLLITRTGILKK